MFSFGVFCGEFVGYLNTDKISKCLSTCCDTSAPVPSCLEKCSGYYGGTTYVRQQLDAESNIPGSVFLELQRATASVYFLIDDSGLYEKTYRTSRTSESLTTLLYS